MSIQLSFLVVIVQILSRSVEAYTNAFMENILETYARNRTLSNGQLTLITSYYCPLLLFLIWIASIVILICTCWYCKFVRSETLTTYDSSSFELQEVSVLEHVKGCTCLDCLHRQLTQELELKNGK